MQNYIVALGNNYILIQLYCLVNYENRKNIDKMDKLVYNLYIIFIYRRRNYEA